MKHCFCILPPRCCWCGMFRVVPISREGHGPFDDLGARKALQGEECPARHDVMVPIDGPSTMTRRG